MGRFGSTNPVQFINNAVDVIIPILIAGGVLAIIVGFGMMLYGRASDNQQAAKGGRGAVVAGILFGVCAPVMLAVVNYFVGAVFGVSA